MAPTFLSYATEKRLSTHPEEFGHGAIEGVAGPEAANNAAAAGVLVPLLTIGLPTSATAAAILTAFQSYGLQPGPQLFSESGPLVWTLIASLYIGNLMLLVLNLPLAKLLRILILGPLAEEQLRRGRAVDCGRGRAGGVGGGADGPQVPCRNPLNRPRPEHSCRMLDY